MNRRTLVGALLALAVSGAVYGLWPKEKLSPEEQIRRMIAKMVLAAEGRDAAGVVDHLDEAFSGPSGTKKPDVKQLLLGQFLRARSIGVLNPTLEVTVASPTTGHFKGTFLFARDGSATGPEASKYELEGDVVLSDGQWRVTSANWNR